MSNLNIKEQSKDLIPKISKAITAFNRAEIELAGARDLLTVMVPTEENLKVCKNTLRDAKKVRKVYSQTRLEATRPLDALKTSVIAWEKSMAKELDLQITTKGAEIAAVEDKIREEEAKRLAEEERKAREEQERLQREAERKQKILDHIRDTDNSLMQDLIAADSVVKLDELITDIGGYNSYDAGEYSTDYTDMLDRHKAAAELKRPHLEELARQEIELEKARQENAEEAKRLLEIQQENAEKQRKAELEAEQLRREVEEAERQKEEDRIKAERQEQERVQREKEEKKRKHEAEMRQKAINAGINIEVAGTIVLSYMDEGNKMSGGIISHSFYTIKWDVPAIKAALKRGETIPGLTITSKDSNNTVIQ